ncbi:MAG: c-type cytochrome [Pyrinomonadaceae bacterium]|nr:c-type cytochrome [Pyrinomonadaceae bacterium]
MKNRRKIASVAAIVLFVMLLAVVFSLSTVFERSVVAQNTSKAVTPSPTPEFDQEAALAKLRERIKGKEKLPAEEVFKNIKNFKGVPAGRLLAIMRFGYARSLGVDCTHCHVPGKWASEEKKTKQIARDMHKMAGAINGELLKNMESLGGRQAIVNCTTCHRGEVKPATNLPRPKPNSE